MNIRNLIAIIWLCAIAGLTAETYEEWLAGQQSAYKQYLSAQDKAFADFLEMQWKPFELQRADPVRETRYPKNTKAPEESPLRTDPTAPLAKPVDAGLLEMEQVEAAESVVETPLVEPGQLPVRFLGFPLVFNYSTTKMKPVAKPVDQKVIANFWYQVNGKAEKELFQQIGSKREDLNLNDWGFCRLLNAVSLELWPECANTRRLFVWVGLLKSGFEARVGYGGDEVFLLLPSKSEIFGQPYITLDGRKFYLISFDATENLPFNIETYQGNHPAAGSIIDFSAKDNPVVSGIIAERLFSFSYDGVEYKIPVKYNQTLVEHMLLYPMTGIGEYFRAPMSDAAKASLARAFYPILEGKPEPVAVNILLRFVQTAFPLAGEQNEARQSLKISDGLISASWLSPRDRSVLLAHLVHDLLALDVVYLDYKDYSAVGVGMGGVQGAQQVVLDGKQYLVCDPGFQNANVGMLQPDYRDQIPTLVGL